jgi:hypothetical protein
LDHKEGNSYRGSLVKITQKRSQGRDFMPGISGSNHKEGKFCQGSMVGSQGRCLLPGILLMITSEGISTRDPWLGTQRKEFLPGMSSKDHKEENYCQVSLVGHNEGNSCQGSLVKITKKGLSARDVWLDQGRDFLPKSTGYDPKEGNSARDHWLGKQRKKFLPGNSGWITKKDFLPKMSANGPKEEHFFCSGWDHKEGIHTKDPWL